MPQRIDMWPWQQVLCSEHDPQSSQYLLILLVLSTFMNPDGSNAHPSQATLAKRARVSVRSVVTHLVAAQRDGWLATYPAGHNGRGWRLSGHDATVPDAVYATLKTPQGSARRAPRREGKRGAPDAPRSSRGGAPDDTEVVHLTTRGGAPGAHNLSLTYKETSCAASPAPGEPGSAAPELDSEQTELVRSLYAKGYTPAEIVDKFATRRFTFDQVNAIVTHLERGKLQAGR